MRWRPPSATPLPSPNPRHPLPLNSRSGATTRSWSRPHPHVSVSLTTGSARAFEGDMGNLKLAGMGAIAASALMLALTGGAFAQAHHYTLGGVPTPAALKQSIAQAPVFRDFLPAAVDLSAYMPPVGDQGDQGSCVGWATAYAARAYYAEQVEHRDTKTPQNQPSPAFVYDLIHQGDSTCDGGSRIPDAMGVLQQGAYSLADFPYSDKSCARPDTTKVSAANDFKIKGYTQVYDAQGDRDLDKVKGALAVGQPVVSLVILDRAFQHLGPANT